MKYASVSLGIIDEDPNGGVYPQLPNYPIVETQNRINLRRNIDSQLKTIIELPDNLEEWLKEIASDLNLDLNRFGVLIDLRK